MATGGDHPKTVESTLATMSTTESNVATTLATGQSSRAAMMSTAPSSIATTTATVPSHMATTIATASSSIAPAMATVPSRIATTMATVPSRIATTMATVPSRIATTMATVPSRIATTMATVPSSIATTMASASSSFAEGLAAAVARIPGRSTQAGVVAIIPPAPEVPRYQDNDQVEMDLLGPLSNYIMHNRLIPLGLHLEFTQADISCIIGSSNRPEDQIRQLFKKWNDMKMVTVKELVADMVKWQKGGCLSPEVWEDFIRPRVNPSLMPSPDVLQLPERPSDPLQLEYPGWPGHQAGALMPYVGGPPPLAIEHQGWQGSQAGALYPYIGGLLPTQHSRTSPRPAIEYQHHPVAPGVSTRGTVTRTIVIKETISSETPAHSQLPEIEGSTPASTATTAPSSDQTHTSHSQAPSGEQQPAPLALPNTATAAPSCEQKSTTDAAVLPGEKPQIPASHSSPTPPGEWQPTSATATPSREQIPPSHAAPTPSVGQSSILQHKFNFSPTVAPSTDQPSTSTPALSVEQPSSSSPPAKRRKTSSVPRRRTLPRRCKITAADIAELQRLTRESLNRMWKDYLSHDWLYPDKAHSFSVAEYYVDLKWTRIVREALSTGKRDLTSIFKVFCVATPGAVNILVTGQPGMGKSASVAMLAMNWVNKSRKLKRFDFVWTIRCRYVDENSSLAELIIAQHDRLKVKEVPVEQIKSILEGKTKHNVLLLVDGYDEYRRGTNKELDGAIESTLGDCFLLLTSRPGDCYVSNIVRDKMDGVLTIEGFSDKNIKKSSILYLGSEEDSKAMLGQAKRSGIYDLLHVPIILLMSCVVYRENKRLPETQTKLFGTAYKIIMDRTTLKTFGKKSAELRNLDILLDTLGELSWKALQNDVQQLLLRKDELEKKAPDVLKLGLLSEVGHDRVTLGEEPTFLSFHHKSLQELSSAQHITKKLETAQDVKATLNELFPSWFDVKRYEEVVVFTAGLLRNPQPLVDHAHQMHIEYRLNDMRGVDDVEGEARVESQGKKTYEVGVFTSLYREASLPGHPLHNQHVNIYEDEDEPPYTPVYVPSRYYDFFGMKEDVTLETHHRQQEEIPECAIWIQEPDAAAAKNVLRTCEKISQLQPVTDLWITDLKCDDVTEVVAPPTISSKARSLVLIDCDLPSGFVSGLLQQFIECPTTLERLFLREINVSEEFKEEWRRRFKEANIPHDIR